MAVSSPIVQWSTRVAYEVPGDDLTTDTDRLMSGEGEFGIRGLDGLAVNLVGPTTVVSEDSGRLGHIKALGNGKDLSIVESLEGSENVYISLDQGSNLHQELASLETWSVLAPSRLEGLGGTVKSVVDIGGQTLGYRDQNLSGAGVVDAEESAS